MITTRSILKDSRDLPRRRDAAREVLSRLGWPSQDVSQLRGQLGSLEALQVGTVGEPNAVIVFGEKGAKPTGPIDVGYSREAPYTMWWADDSIELHQTVRWRSSPGDVPLVQVDPVGPSAEGALSLLHPESLKANRPKEYAKEGSVHSALHVRLGDALRALRHQVAQAGALEGIKIEAADSALLRLFHQLLFIRFQEDRGLAATGPPLREIGEFRNPQGSLSDLLEKYSRELNSELFAHPGISIDSVPPAALAEVIRAMVEPWRRLRLNFSVTRSEIAGRLYQSYLERTPTIEEAQRSGAPATLFPLVEAIDERERGASYYTPPPVARQLAEQTLRPWLREQRPTSPDEVRVVDPACGSGAFLIAAFRILAEYFEEQPPGRRFTRGEVLRGSIFGADVDERAIGLAQIQLLEEARLGAERLPQLGGNLFVGDSLAHPPGTERDSGEGCVPWEWIISKRGPFDVVLANPPFGAQVSLPRRLVAEERASVRGHYPEVAGWGSDYSYLFLALARRLLGERGALGFVLPRTFLDGKSAQSVRRFFGTARLSRIVDFRGLKLFDVSSYVCLVSTDQSDGDCLAQDVSDSRADSGDVLETLARRESSPLVRAVRVGSGQLAAADDGWSPFRLRWAAELAAHVGVDCDRLAPPSGKGDRIVIQGTQPGDLKRFVIGRSEWKRVGRAIRVNGYDVPTRLCPRFVRGPHLQPFVRRDEGERLFLPFEDDGSLTADPSSLELLKSLGGPAAHPQPGDLVHLRKPKILLRAFAREPAAVVDSAGDWMTIKGTGGALSLLPGEESAHILPGIVALLNSGFYQWLLRGLGRPRSDETIELNVSDVAALPWPQLRDADWDSLAAAGEQVVASLGDESPVARVEAYWPARAALDDLVLDCLDVAGPLRTLVAVELLRPS